MRRRRGRAAEQPAIDGAAIAIFPAHNAPHQEGWRDWPDETPATPSDLGPRKVPTPAGLVVRPGRCGKSAPHGTSAHIEPGGGLFVEEPDGSPIAEMQGVRGRVPARRSLRLRAVIRAAGGLL